MISKGSPEGKNLGDGELSVPGYALLDVRTAFDPGTAARATLRHVLGADSDLNGVAWLALPSKSGELMIEHVLGSRTTLLDQLAIPEGVGLTGKVFSYGAVDWVENYSTASTITHEFDALIEAEGVIRMLAAPLRVAGAVIGTLTLASRNQGAFGDVALTHITGLAGEVGLAIEIARRSREHAEAAAAAERKRITEQLHDSVGALMFSISARTERLRQRFDTEDRSDPDLSALQQDAGRANEHIRELLADWRSPQPDDLAAEIVADAKHFESRSGVRCDTVFLGQQLTLDGEHRDAVIRFTREALLNVEKHARAGAVSIMVAMLIDQVTVAVSDDGRGLAENPDRGFGLRVASDRIERLGGVVSVVNDDDTGVIARAVIPL